MQSAKPSIPVSSEPDTLTALLATFPHKRIGVIGDVMLDIFTRGRIERISPEAPVPVVLMESEQWIPGGAANVACGIQALGAQVELFSVRGDDLPGKALEELLQKKSVKTYLSLDERPTTVKHRFVAQGRHMLRVDWEQTHAISESHAQEEIKRISSHMATWDAVVIADYAKGYLTPLFVQAVLVEARARSLPVIVDTKPSNINFFTGVTLLTPNAKEALEMAETENISEAGRTLQSRLSSSILVTQGADGMTLFHEEEYHTSAKASTVLDVSGAGDTVVATTALAIASGASLIQAVDLAGIAAGIVVGKEGTAAVTNEELRAAVSQA